MDKTNLFKVIQASRNVTITAVPSTATNQERASIARQVAATVGADRKTELIVVTIAP